MCSVSHLVLDIGGSLSQLHFALMEQDPFLRIRLKGCKHRLRQSLPICQESSLIRIVPGAFGTQGLLNLIQFVEHDNRRFITEVQIPILG